jgi:hypothetical protein
MWEKTNKRIACPDLQDVTCNARISSRLRQVELLQVSPTPDDSFIQQRSVEAYLLREHYHQSRSRQTVHHQGAVPRMVTRSK